jgi:hypothetical protein
MGDFTAEGPGTNVAVISLASWRGYLYAGTQNDDGGFQLWRSNARSPEDPGPGEWARIIDSGAGDLANTRALTLKVFKDALWVGTSMFPLSGDAPFLLPPKGFELIRVEPDDSWTLVIGDYLAQKPPGDVPILRTPESGWPGGFGNFLNIYCWSLGEINGVLYLGTFDMSSFLYALLDEPSLFEVIDRLVPPGTLESTLADLQVMETEALPKQYRRLLSQVNGAAPGTLDWGDVWREFLERFAGADLWKSQDGLHWYPVTLNGMGNQENYGFRTMTRFNSLYLGSANPFSGLDMFRAVNGKSRAKE